MVVAGMEKDEKIAELEGIIRQQAATIEALTQEISELKFIIADLQEKLNKNSRNSSKDSFFFYVLNVVFLFYLHTVFL